MTQKNNQKQEQIAETFEAELESIKAKGKDLKGENRDFFASIVQRLENNNACLKDLRIEHTQLREQLSALVKEKQAKTRQADLPTEIKRYNHKVNNLKKQIDNLKHKRTEAVARQEELKVILANFENATATENPELERVRLLKNKLDNANIKNQETNHMMKVYNQIIYLLDRQKMHWNRLVQEQQKKITEKQRDINELTLIARDSQHSRTTATNEFIRAQQAKSIASQKREAMIRSKVEQLHTNMHVPIGDPDPEMRQNRPRQSLNSGASAIRNRANRQQRDMKEEKFRNVSAQYDEIREYFGTNDPDEILAFFTDRRRQMETLTKQIEELKESCTDLTKKVSQTRAQLEEAEYTSAKGVGGSRMLIEGRRILNEKSAKLDQARREEAAQSQNRRSVLAGIAHLADVMALVQKEDAQTEEACGTLKWATSTVGELKNALQGDDTDYVALCNPAQLAALVARDNAMFDIHSVDSSKRVKRSVDPLRRPVKEAKNDISSRVMDRNATKREAQRVVEMMKPNKKENNN